MTKLIIISAPSGTGKSTIIEKLLQDSDLNLHFSISATSRDPRGEEIHGREYYFLSPQEFREKIEANEFVEYEEVYKDKYYGTLKIEVDRILRDEKNVIFDVDVVGAQNIKKYYGDRALAIFILPPSIEELRARLEKRGTDSTDTIRQRVAKAEKEIDYAHLFDLRFVNDDLTTCVEQIRTSITRFLAK